MVPLRLHVACAAVFVALAASLSASSACAQLPVPADEASSHPPPSVHAEAHPEARAKASDASLYWIFLAPRPDSSLATVADAPAPVISSAVPRAARRRAQRGRPDASAALTRPVAPAYVEGLRAAGVVPRVQSRWLHAVSARLTPPQRDRVEGLPYVEGLRSVARGVRTQPEQEGEVQATRSPVFLPSPVLPLPLADSSFYGASYTQLGLANALAPLERGLHGEGVRLGFLDTRFRALRHPAFNALRADGRLRGLRDFTQGDQTNNHGGAVASVAVGYAPGVLVGPAHRAEVLAAATEYTASERNVEEDAFVAGLEWMEAQGADVVNVSLGYTRFDDGQRSYTTDDLDGDTGVTTRAVDAATQLGMVVVVSAGNSGCDTPDNCWFYVSTPADADSSIAVGGIQQDSSLVSFSSRGPTADGRIKPDVVALGSNVAVAWGEDRYVASGGTSFASPLVAAVVAQMLQANPSLTPMDVRSLLRQTASRANEPDNEYGWGVVNADAAIRAAVHQAREAPPAQLVARPPAPNPARTEATFPVDVPDGLASLDVSLYDVLGRRVRHQTTRVQPGPNRVTVRVADLPPGVYLYRLKGAERLATGKLVVLR